MIGNNLINTGQAAQEDVDLKRLLGALVDNRWLIIGFTNFITALGITYALLATPIYRADALVQVEQNTGNALINDITRFLPTSQPISATEIELVRSRMVLGKTIDDLSLENHAEPKYFPVVGKGVANLLGKNNDKEIGLSRIWVSPSLSGQNLVLKLLDQSEYIVSFDGKKIITGKVGKLVENNYIKILLSDIKGNAGDEFNIRHDTLIDTYNSLYDNLNIVDKGKDTGILSLTLTGENRERTEQILNSICDNYLEQNVERKSEEAAKSLSFLEQQLPMIKNNLNQAEDKLNTYRQRKDSVDLTLEAKSVLDSIVSVDAQLDELTFREAEISKLYTKEHPAYRALLEKRQTLEDEKNDLNKRVNGMPVVQQEILRLTRDVESDQQVYMQLLNKQQELSVNKASTVGNVRIVDHAVTLDKPISPQKILIIIASFIVGFFLSSLYVVIKSLFVRGIERPEDIESIGLSVYASIPLSEWQINRNRELLKEKYPKSKNINSVVLLATGNPADLAIEALRSLRTSIHFAMLEAKNNILIISGASPETGKTFVSMNLAAVVAQGGLKVLAIDADMRKGYSHVIMGSNWDHGLSDILSGEVDFSEAVRKTDVANLDFIPRGQIPPNPSELLLQKKLPELLHWANENYDLVLIDTPPILAVTDAAIIAQSGGSVLLVARFEKNTTKEVEVSKNRFTQSGVDVKGVILNAVVKKAANYYSYGYSYEPYSYK